MEKIKPKSTGRHKDKSHDLFYGVIRAFGLYAVIALCMFISYDAVINQEPECRINHETLLK